MQSFRMLLCVVAPPLAGRQVAQVSRRVPRTDTSILRLALRELSSTSLTALTQWRPPFVWIPAPRFREGTSFAGMTVWSYRQLINRIVNRYEKAIYGIKNIRISGRKNGFCLETKFFNEKELICLCESDIFLQLKILLCRMG